MPLRMGWVGEQAGERDGALRSGDVLGVLGIQGFEDCVDEPSETELWRVSEFGAGHDGAWLCSGRQMRCQTMSIVKSRARDHGWMSNDEEKAVEE